MNFHLLKASIRERKNKDISVKTQRFAELARQAFQTLVEVEYEALGGAINNDAQEDHNAEAGDEGSTIILQSLTKTHLHRQRKADLAAENIC